MRRVLTTRDTKQAEGAQSAFGSIGNNSFAFFRSAGTVCSFVFFYPLPRPEKTLHTHLTFRWNVDSFILQRWIQSGKNTLPMLMILEPCV